MTISKSPRLAAAAALIARFAAPPETARGRSSPDAQSSPLGWPITRDALVQQLRRRIEGSDLPRQVNTSYCGPAAFLYCVLEDRPDIYADYAIAMWTRGEYDFRSPLRTLDVASNQGVRSALAAAQKAKPGQRFISDLDWMTMAPLSMSTRPFGLVFGTPAPDDQVGSISYPGVVREWFAAAGARLREDTMGVGLMKSPTSSTLKLLAQWPTSWIVLQIDSSLLSGGTTSTFRNRHWVVVNPHRRPLVRVAETKQVVPMSEVLKSVPAGHAMPDLGTWQTSLYFASWGNENTPMHDQHLGQLAGRIYGGFAFSHFR
jgi:hypothetical protein